MKKALLFLLLIFTIQKSFAQLIFPAKWTFTKEDNKKGEYTLHFNVKLDQDWHLYSQFTEDGGPLPMVFKFDKSSCVKLIGKVTEPKPEVEFDSLFGVTVKLFSKQAELKQKIKITGTPCQLKGTIEYQVCKESCIFKDTTFTFTFDADKSEVIPAVIDTSSLQPADSDKADVQPKKTEIASGTLEDGCGTGAQSASDSDRTLFAIFLAGFIGGFVALLTPCVFPMIPMTVSFFY